MSTQLAFQKPRGIHTLILVWISAIPVLLASALANVPERLISLCLCTNYTECFPTSHKIFFQASEFGVIIDRMAWQRVRFETIERLTSGFSGCLRKSCLLMSKVQQVVDQGRGSARSDLSGGQGETLSSTMKIWSIWKTGLPYTRVPGAKRVQRVS